MPTWLGLVILVALVASRPIEARLWRAGRISNRTVTILLLGRFPVIVAIGAWATGGLTIITVALVAISLVLPMAFYRYFLSLVQEQSVLRGDSSSADSIGARE